MLSKRSTLLRPLVALALAAAAAWMAPAAFAAQPPPGGASAQSAAPALPDVVSAVVSDDAKTGHIAGGLIGLGLALAAVAAIIAAGKRVREGGGIDSGGFNPRDPPNSAPS